MGISNSTDLSPIFCLFNVNFAYAANIKPTVVSISPSNGTSDPYQAVNFVATYADANGWQNIQLAYFMTTGNGFYGSYDQNQNKLYVYNPTTRVWVGGFAPGTANIIDTTYSKLDCSRTTVTGSGNNLTVNWNIAFKTNYTGQKALYLMVKDDSNLASVWINKGKWTITANKKPVIESLSPVDSTRAPNAVSLFNTVFSDGNGYQDIQLVYFMTTGYGFYGYYNPAQNKLYVYSIQTRKWLGGFSPGSANIIDTYYSKLDCSQTTVTGSNNNLTVKWAVVFKPNYKGKKLIYLYVKDSANAIQGYLNKGSVTIQADTTAPTGTIKINNGSQYTKSLAVVLSLTSQDNAGGSGVTQMQFSDNGVSWLAPENYAVSKPWTLRPGDGSKTIYVKFKDAAGNWSAPHSSSINLDTIPPAIVITAPSNGELVVDANVALRGTIDGVAFSETHVLTQQGDNTLIKTASDPAGNSSTASITVVLNSGTLIGPLGGEAASPDGRVKITVPKGALTSIQRISLLTLDTKNLNGLTPSGNTLLCAVECKPIGLIFLIPASITYAFDKAQIPGTKVSLGLYEDGKIYFTSEPSVIPVDGYHATFNIRHFSTYTALASMVSQGAPIGAGVKIPLPDLLTGSFSHGIPLTVPPEEKACSHRLALVTVPLILIHGLARG